MLKTLFCFSFLLSCLPGLTQDRNTDWSAFNQHLDAGPYQGYYFRIDAAVKVELIDSAAEAAIWVRVDRPNKKIGFFYNMRDKPIRSSSWKVYSIEGKIDKDATTIFFGGLYHRKALFYFDEFKFYTSKDKKQWEEIALPESGFESDTALISKHWHWAKNNDKFPAGITTKDAYSGSHSFLIDRTHVKLPEDFGNNPETGHYAIVNNIRIYYEVYGQGQPLLLLHGNSASISSFKKQIPELAAKFKVIAVDTRGQGKSTEDGRTYSYDLFAEDMKGLLDHLQLDSVNIVGWSDGGNTGLIMAIKYPSKVKKLVTMGANIFISDEVVEKWVFKELKKEKKDLLKDSFPGNKHRLRMIELLLTEPKHNFAELRTISCPVLVIAGEKDVIREEHTKTIAASIPKGKLMIMKDGTHYLPDENPSAFNKAVIEFLERIPE